MAPYRNSIATGTVGEGEWAGAVEAARPGWLVLFASWAKVEPTRGRYDEDEVLRCRRVLVRARRQGIEPVVVLHAGALPDWQIAREGWLDPDGLAAWGCFADKLAHALGDQVHLWFSLWEPLGEADWYDDDSRRVARLLLDAQASAYLHLKRAPGFGGRPALVGVMERWSGLRGGLGARVRGAGDPAESLFRVLATGRLALPFAAVGELPNGTPAVDVLGLRCDGADPAKAVDRLWHHGRGIVLADVPPGTGAGAWDRGVRVLAELT
jgi:hypothetical protein